jgi:2-C-methyl-D-erythritol 4-phosphate cytidylyltransferase
MAAHGRLTVAAIVVAGGAGVRLGAGVPKAFVAVAGRTLLEHAVTRLAAHPGVRDVIAVVPADRVGDAAIMLPGAAVVAGAATRQRSVSCGLAALAPDIDTVLVHDAARAFAPAGVVSRVLEALAAGAQAVVPTVPVADSLRAVAADGSLGAAVERACVVAVQTPQGFARGVLDAAHSAADSDDATDDASLVAALGVSVHAVAGAEQSVKITGPLDLRIAEALAGE